MHTKQGSTLCLSGDKYIYHRIDINKTITSFPKTHFSKTHSNIEDYSWEDIQWIEPYICENSIKMDMIT